MPPPEQCPLLAQSGHVLCTAECPLSRDYPRSADYSEIAMPKWLSGTFDRYAAPRVPRSHHNLWRGGSAANPVRLCGKLQSSSHTLGLIQGCTPKTGCTAVW